MDLDHFFNFFSPNSDVGYSKSEIKDFKNNPYYKIRMFERLILNGLSFKKSIINFFSQADETLDMVQVDLAGEFMMYNRAWFWVDQLEWDDEEWVEGLKKASNENLLTSVKLAINYFEEQEEYEKCAFLKKVQDFVQNYLAVED
jgi:hypothetical protein